MQSIRPWQTSFPRQGEQDRPEWSIETEALGGSR